MRAERIERRHPVATSEPVDPGTDGPWATVLTAHPDGLPYGHPARLQTLAHAYSHAPFPLACTDAQGCVHGVVPFVYRRRRRDGRWLWSLSRTSVAGPTTTRGSAALIRKAIELTEGTAWQHLFVDAMRPDRDRRDVPLTRSTWCPSDGVGLQPAVRRRCIDDSRRGGLTRARRDGLRVRYADRVEGRRAWYDLYLTTCRRKRYPLLPCQFFEAAWARMGSDGRMRLLLAEHRTLRGTELLGGTLLPPCAPPVVEPSSTDGQDSRCHHPRDMPLWASMHQAWEQAYRRYGLDDTVPGKEGQAQAEFQLGSQAQPLPRYDDPAEQRSRHRIAHETGDTAPLPVMQADWQRRASRLTEVTSRHVHRYLLSTTRPGEQSPTLSEEVRMSLETRRAPVSHSPPSSLRVIPIDPTADGRWATYVTTHPEGLAFHHPGWIQTLSDTFNYPPAHLACEDEEGTLHGVLPLVYRQGRLRGRRLWSLPYTGNAGPLASSAEAASALVQAAVDLTRNSRGYRLQLHSMRSDLAPMDVALRRVEWYPTVVIDLPDASEPPRFSKSRRRGMEKARRAGIEVHEAEQLADLRAWYHLYLRMVHRKGRPPLPFSFFAAAWERMRPLGMLRLIIAERYTARGAELLGGAIVLNCSQTVTDMFATDEPSARRYHPADLILGESITRAWQAGYRYYDLGDIVPGQPGLQQFKQAWGGRQRPVFRYFYPVEDDAKDTLTHHAHGSALLRLGQAYWRYLPLGLTERIGRWLYQYL